MELLEKPTLVVGMPNAISKAANALLPTRKSNFSAVKLIQKRFVTDDRMSEFWKTFKTLPEDTRDRAAQLFFAKCPRIIARGDDAIKYLSKAAKDKRFKHYRKLEIGLKQAEDLAKTLKFLGARKEIISNVKKITYAIEERMEDMGTSSSSYFQTEPISRKYGEDYIKAFDFEARGKGKPEVLYSIRVVYLVMRECGFKRPSLKLVGIAAAVAASVGDSDIDKTSVRNQVKHLSGRLSFVKEPHLSIKDMFGPIGEDSKTER